MLHWALSGVVQLLHQLTLRRWSHPCREFRNIILQIFLPFDGSYLTKKFCYIDDSLLSAPGTGQPYCSVTFFRSWFSNNNWQNNQNAACANIYSKLLGGKLKFYKFNIITDKLVLAT